MKGQGAVDCMIASKVLGDQRKFIDAAIAAGMVPILPAKADGAKYLKTKKSQISWTSLVTGVFFDWPFRSDFFDFDLKTKTITWVDGGYTEFTGTTLPQIGGGGAVVSILEKPELTKNQYVYCSSLNTKMGRKKYVAGDYSGIMGLVIASAFTKRALGDSRAARLWDEKLGLPKEDLEETTKNLLSE
ncbi:hypothetical protein BS50DRAFT_679570 [Corynespora cassiicola Philippines]|uniref:NmrA-like domain-containing protein n=1 Tax=Corynespora cassiicola Philippines TaxID=1448308 RepID=A0A2T2NCU6_CORCC|nr:hypothetical protein BS50DRAFT_679570 [Corynespora cassiicola Philippines]